MRLADLDMHHKRGPYYDKWVIAQITYADKLFRALRESVDAQRDSA